MAISIADFKTKFPEFVDVEDVAIQWEIDVLNSLGFICEKEWPNETAYCFAFYLLLAHNLSLTPAGDPSGEDGEGIGQSVASEAVGDVSISFDNSRIGKITSDTDGDITKELKLTTYGIRYNSIRRRLGFFVSTTANKVPGVIL